MKMCENTKKSCFGWFCVLITIHKDSERRFRYLLQHTVVQELCFYKTHTHTHTHTHTCTHEHTHTHTHTPTHLHTHSYTHTHTHDKRDGPWSDLCAAGPGRDGGLRPRRAAVRHLDREYQMHRRQRLCFSCSWRWFNRPV
jgi:hypothetical protein